MKCHFQLGVRIVDLGEAVLQAVDSMKKIIFMIDIKGVSIVVENLRHLSAMIRIIVHSLDGGNDDRLAVKKLLHYDYLQGFNAI